MPISPQETRATLRQRSEAARRGAAQRAAELSELVRREVATRLPAGGRAWLIGSLAWGGFGVRSDIDLVVSGLDAAARVDLELAVVRLTGVPVDLLCLEELPQSFATRVRAEGVPLHGAG